MNPTITILILFLFAATSVQAQVESVEDSSANASEFVSEDTLVSDDDFVMTKSPLGAVLRSAIIPGWGQFYNESYWKIPVVLGVTGFLVYGWVTENNQYVIYRDQYEADKDLEEPLVSLSQTKLSREFYRNRRDTYAWWFGVFYLLQVADALVDAHLYDFDVSDEVKLSFRASAGGSLSMQLRW
jgi:Family of unknown function (DUF5683)